MTTTIWVNKQALTQTQAHEAASPSFITKRTNFNVVMSAMGSPASAIKSAALPGSSEPTSFSTANKVAA